jgi:hypothetical protein
VNLLFLAPPTKACSTSSGVANFPGGRVFPVREAWDLSVIREWRDRMSALLNLDN